MAMPGVIMTWNTKEVVVSHTSFNTCKNIPWWVNTVSCPGFLPACAAASFTAAAWRFECFNTVQPGVPAPSSMTATLKLLWSSVPTAEQPVLLEHFTRNRQLTLLVRFGTSQFFENLSVTLQG